MFLIFWFFGFVLKVDRYHGTDGTCLLGRNSGMKKRTRRKKKKKEEKKRRKKKKKKKKRKEEKHIGSEKIGEDC